MKLVILAGGLGTRLSEETKKIPKPMVKIGKIPIIQHIINYYEKFNVELTRHGNPKPGTDDEADAIVVALSHFDLRDK